MVATLSLPKPKPARCYKMCLAGGLVVRTACEPLPPIDFEGNSIDGALFEAYLPTELLKEAIFDRWRIEVHSIFPELITRFPKALGFDAVEMVEFEPMALGPKYAALAPRYFKVRRGFQWSVVVAASPGRDSLVASGELIARYLDKIARQRDFVTLHRHPDLEKQLFDWAGLDERFIMPFDQVVIGFADEIGRLIRGQVDCAFLSSFENNHFTSTRYRLAGGLIVNFLEVRFSLIGDIGAGLCYKIASLGAANIIYCGRLHAVADPYATYSKIYSPARYIYQNSEGVVRYIVELKNPLHACGYKSDTGWHLTSSGLPKLDTIDAVPQLSDVCSKDANIGAMAAAIEDASHQIGAQVGFAPIHFAPSWIKSPMQNAPFPVMDQKKLLYALRLVTLSVRQLLLAL